MAMPIIIRFGSCYIYNNTPQVSLKLQTRPRFLNYYSKSKLKSLQIYYNNSNNNKNINNDNGEEDEGLVQDIRVPIQWLNPNKATQESEWLRVTLHKWLDDEYCPEPTNEDISRIAARSYYKSLVDKETDIGDIFIKMALDLESISYQESFHGPFSSANAAIDLIIQKIEQLY